jgi:hypothetical protein
VFSIPGRPAYQFARLSNVPLPLLPATPLLQCQWPTPLLVLLSAHPNACWRALLFLLSGSPAAPQTPLSQRPQTPPPIPEDSTVTEDEPAGSSPGRASRGAAEGQTRPRCGSLEGELERVSLRAEAPGHASQSTGGKDSLAEASASHAGLSVPIPVDAQDARAASSLFQPTSSDSGVSPGSSPGSASGSVAPRRGGGLWLGSKKEVGGGAGLGLGREGSARKGEVDRQSKAGTGKAAGEKNAHACCGRECKPEVLTVLFAKCILFEEARHQCVRFQASWCASIAPSLSEGPLLGFATAWAETTGVLLVLKRSSSRQDSALTFAVAAGHIRQALIAPPPRLIRCDLLAGDGFLYPSDILPFTRRPLVLIVDSESSTAFQVRNWPLPTEPSACWRCRPPDAHTDTVCLNLGQWLTSRIRCSKVLLRSFRSPSCGSLSIERIVSALCCPAMWLGCWLPQCPSLAMLGVGWRPDLQGSVTPKTHSSNAPF